MMAKRSALLVVALGLLSGCQHTGYGESAPRALLQQDNRLPNPRDGVVVAESKLVGQATAINAELGTPDCDGPGLGIRVETTTADDRYLIDKRDKPCPVSDVLFDGKMKVYQRAADPGVSIAFRDKFGQQVDSEQPEPLLPTIDMLKKVDSSLPDAQSKIDAPKGTSPTEESADAMPDDLAQFADQQRKMEGETDEQFRDRLSTTINRWKTDEQRQRLMQEAEQVLADARNVNRLTSFKTLREQQQKIALLTARLREAERVAQLQQQKRETMADELAKSRSELDAHRLIKDKETRDARDSAEQLMQRTQELERYSERLKREADAKEQAYQEKIAKMSADLKAAEAQANAARHAAVLQAAQQIAEAERLAEAAKVAQRVSMEREAERLAKEAEELSRQASALPTEVKEPDNSLKTAYADMVSGAIKDGDTARLARIINNSRPIGDRMDRAQLMVHEQDKPLKDIFAKIFKDLEPRLGPWNVSWELSAPNMYIADEPWTVAAESSLNDFLTYVVDTVRETHGIDLHFKVLEKNNLLVITD
ncbi:MAG: hypothetical protein GC134_10005 [Proteobacteria bacterium]|nr:hypothetical protein [Pseudomonadota bacterium]